MRNQSSRTRVLRLCRGAAIAALYVALTYLAMLMGLDKGAVQIRFSEALCVLAAFLPEAVPGLYVGCLLANILTGAMLPDIILGPVATLIGALGAYMLGAVIRKRGIKSIAFKCLVPLPTVIANTAIVPFVIYYCYIAPSERTLAALPAIALGVLAGEIISAGVMGMLLYLSLEKSRMHL